MVNLETGSYYSLNPVGTYIWTALEDGADVDEIVNDLARTFAADPAVVDPDLRAFVARLVGEGLIVPRPDDSAATRRRDGIVAGATYQAPTLDHYTDMQELLLLDPVHEVDATGWPARP